MPVNPNPQILQAQNGPFSQLRTGLVASATEQNVVVVVGGTSFTAQALDTYSPAEGDLVAVLRQDATWLVLGRIAGQGPNEVLNPSFESTPVGLQPSEWTLYDVSGTSEMSVVSRPGAPGGTRTLQVRPNSGGTDVSIVYSSPIDVVPGEVWNLAAYVGGQYEEFVAPTADSDLMALWFANETNLYPTTSATDTVVASVADVTQLPPFTGMSGTVTVPSGAAVMRVGLRSTLDPNQALEYDLVTARRVGERAGEGFISYTSRTTNTAGVTTTHTVGFGTPLTTFHPGRAYKVHAKGFVQSSVANDTVRIRILKDTTAGQGFIDTFDGLEIHGANGMTTFNHENIFRVAPAGPAVTASLVMTYVRNTGTGTVFIGATSANPAYIELHDVGDYNSYPGANVLV